MRLNRVPTSVRLAAELIKNPSGSGPSNLSGNSPPSAGSAASTASVPTPNPSPAGSVPTANYMPRSATRELGAFSSMPPPPAPGSTPSPLDLGKGRPSLSVPATPMATRNVSPTSGSSFAMPTAVNVPEKSRIPLTAKLAPPTSGQTPISSSPARPRPSLPFDTPALDEPFKGGRHHRYRVSMHETNFKPSFSAGLTESPPSEWSPPAEATALTSGGLSRAAAFGLGLNIPPLPAHLTTTSASGSLTPGAPANMPRVRSTTGKTLQMDLAGVPSLGDAASHASMIMQSRQAKLQRWRPSSAGNQVSPY